MNRFSFLLIIVITLTSVTIDASVNVFKPVAEEGKNSLQLKEYEKAHSYFTLGHKLAKELDDKTWTAKFMFYQANTYLLEATADGTVNTEKETELAKKAVRLYQQVVKLLPKSGASKINLARAYAMLGDNKSADVWYQQAINQNDKKQLLYRRQYASHLEKSNPEAAAKELRAIIDSQPNNLKAHRMLMQIYQNPKLSKQLYTYLNELIKKGEVIRAQNSAFEILTNPDWPKKSQPDMLVVIASSFAKQFIAPDEFKASEAALNLRKISATHPSLRKGVAELFRTMLNQKATKYKWWTKDTTRSSAISALLRSRARYYDQTNNPKLAEGFYKNAIEIKGAKDPAAIRDMVNFYSKRGDINKINEISSTYEYELFEQKGQAIRSGDLEKIYDYHRTLGSIYSFQAIKSGDWGDPNKMNTAAFQLERAYQASEKSKSIIPDTQLINNLATSYETKGQVSLATRVRINSAEKYEFNNNTIAAKKVLQAVKVTDLSDAQKIPYNRINTSVLKPPIDSSNTTLAPSDTPIAPREQNPTIQNPNIQNPNIQNPTLQNPANMINPETLLLNEQLISPELLKQKAIDLEKLKAIDLEKIKELEKLKEGGG